MEALLIGRTLAGRYLVEGVLGRGGMSVVYRAMDSRLGRPVAVKIVAFPPGMSQADRTDLRSRLRREAAAAACIASHPNVVQVYDHGTDDELDLDFITMELLTGEDLKSTLREGEVGLDEGLEILQQAARGIAAGHRAGIVHRDVKPANILLAGGAGDRLVVKVLDFGIAKAFENTDADDITRSDLSPHSPGYASPEQLAGGGPQTTASDVYQLGLVGYELLSGVRPYSEEERREIAAGRPVPLKAGGRWMTVPVAVREVIETALSPDPSRRYPSAAEFAMALDAAIEGDATVAYPGRESRALVPPPPVQLVEAVEVPPVRRSPTPSAGPRKRPFALYLASGAAPALLLWLLLQSRSPDGAEVAERSGPTEEDQPASLSNIDQLDSEFRPLLLEASQRLSDTN